MTYQTYLVGGAVRDQIMGLKPKDMDYAVEAPSFSAMREDLLARGFVIFQEREEFGVIRARKNKETSDYVLCRKEGPYTDQRHPDWVTIGTIEDDLARRDFTINALARNVETGEVLDLWGGVDDIEGSILRAVGDPSDRLTEDPLRGFRAIRFAVTKGFHIDPELAFAMRLVRVLDGLEATSVERMREELGKAFAFDSAKTMRLLVFSFPEYLDIAQERGLWYTPTTAKR